MQDDDPHEESRRLREEAIQARQGLRVVVEQLRAQRAGGRRAALILWRTVAGPSAAAEGTAIAVSTSPLGEPAMRDGLSYRGQQDRRRINVDEPPEVRYWTAAFGVSEEELRSLIKRVGPMVVDVREAVARR